MLVVAYAATVFIFCFQYQLWWSDMGTGLRTFPNYISSGKAMITSSSRVQYLQLLTLTGQQ
jgi:hypothetical protein